jgi:hypothetical protein
VRNRHCGPLKRMLHCLRALVSPDLSPAGRAVQRSRRGVA